MVDAGPGELARRAAAHVLVDDLVAPVLSDDDLHHLGSVLRLKPGEIVGLTDGRGGWRSSVWAGDGVAEAGGDVVRVSRPEPAVCVGFAPVKGDRNEWAVQKLTELGVDRIVLLSCVRGVVRWDEGRAASHMERFRKVARQALMQSRGLWMPALEGLLDVSSFLSESGAAIADPSGSPLTAEIRTVLIGPEGGWSEKEVSDGCDPVRLGDGVLRTETAAIVAGVFLTAMRSGLVAPAATDAR